MGVDTLSNYVDTSPLSQPAAFFKGILLPLCKENCTLREAAIVSSVLAKVSIPVAHSAVALHKISTLGYSGGQAVFIRTLLDKKYSLPVPVIRALVDYFSIPYKKSLEANRPGGYRPSSSSEPLPVLWHQALLVFVQRYKSSLTADDKELIRQSVKVENHHQITKEVRRELFGVKGFKNDFEGADDEGMEA